MSGSGAVPGETGTKVVVGTGGNVPRGRAGGDDVRGGDGDGEI